MEHKIERVRHDLKRRSLVVTSVDAITPAMLRVTLTGDDLADFTSLGADDHIKVFVPGTSEMRDYTPRRYDNEARTLTVDFALHDAGPATAWARGAKPGDPLTVGGPKGSLVVSNTFDWWLLIGDETALPAIGRRLEELPAGTKVTTIIAVTGADEEQAFETACDHTAIWVHRPSDSNDDPAPLLAALKTMTLPSGDGFVWIGAEAQVARALRAEVTGPMRHPLSWLKASGYWVKGQADASDKG